MLNLAWHFGEWNIDKWLGSITIEQLLEWVEFANIEPVLPIANSLHFGTLGATIANSIPNFSKQRRKAIKPTDLFPWIDQNWQPTNETVDPQPNQSTTTTNMASYVRFKSQLRKFAGHKHIITN